MSIPWLSLEESKPLEEIVANAVDIQALQNSLNICASLGFRDNVSPLN